MSKAEGSLTINSRNAVSASEDKSGEAAKLYPPIEARRKLADISNLPQKEMPFTVYQKSHSIPITVKEYIEQLQKENLALAKMLAQRNKIVEQSGIELERLRLNLIKLREQNQHLALSHTQMLAELNSGKDKLKALQHELGCRNVLLQARSSKLEKANLIKEDESSIEGSDHEKSCKAKKKLPSLSLGSPEQLQSEDNAGNRLPVRRQSANFKAVKDDTVSKIDEAKFSKCSLSDGTAPSTSADASVINEDSVANLLCKPSARRQSARFKAETPKQGDDLSGIDASTSGDGLVCNEYHAGSRQSARFAAARAKQADNLTEMEEAKCGLPVPDNDSTVENEDHAVQRRRQTHHRFKAKQSKQDLLKMDDTTSLKRSSCDDVKNEDGSSCSGSGGRCESQEVRKPTLGRPSRLAAQKIQSYKEIPRNVKMRRSD